MNPHSKVRSVAKWSGTAITFVLLTLWLASAWGWVQYVFPRASGGWILGGFSVGWFPDSNTTSPSDTPGWDVHIGGFYFGFINGFEFSKQYQGVPITNVGVPGWFLALLPGLPTALAWRRDIMIARRQSLRGKCPRCTFDLTGLASDAVCPECGKPPTPRT